MSISVNKLTEKINASSARETISELDLLQLQLAANSISQVYSVASVAALPPAANNKGRMVYVSTESRYYLSDGTSWSDDMDTSLVLSPSGTIFGFGNNFSGRLGNNTADTIPTSPTSVVGGFTDWCQISGNSDRNAAGIRTNGTLWTWGINNYGHLGDCSTVAKSSPVSVVGGFTDWCQVSASYRAMAAIRTNGTIYTWGALGLLGDASAGNERSSPGIISGGFTNWCQVSLGDDHAAALRTNGTLWTWGVATCGRLGDGTETDKNSPVSVIGGFTDWCQVSAGGRHTAAVRRNGTIWTWGANYSGNLGDGTTVAKCSPISVVGGFTDWCQVSTASNHTAAVRQNGTLWTWGSGSYGKLGDGTTVAKCSPISVVGGFTDWCQVSAFSIGATIGVTALKTDGTLWYFGSLQGIGTRCSPTSLSSSINAWQKVSGSFALETTITKGF